jgi:hypothetical protein
MLGKKSVLLFILFTFFTFTLNTAAQTNQETEPAERSELAATDLPTGGERMLEQSVPEDLKKVLAKLVAEGGDKIRQGDSEVLTWSGKGYKKSTSVQLMKQIEANLQRSGWEYEIGKSNDDVVLFSLLRQTPKRRGLLGFFVPSDDGLVLAMTEILPTGAPVAEANNSSGPEPEVEVKGSNTANTSNTRELFGKWAWANTGSSIRDYTGKTIAGSGSRFTYEFSPNGTVEYVGIMHSASLAGCRLEAFSTKKGKFSIDGNRMTIAWAPASFSRDDTCTPSQNYKKTLPAETETQTWEIKHEDYGRTLLCINSKGSETCFDRSSQ